MDPTPRVTCRPATHMLSAGTPTRAFVCGYPYASPAPSSLIQYSHRGYPYALCRHPHPARAFGAPPPPPPRGRGQCVAISGEQPYPGCSRWAAVSGVEPVGHRARLFSSLFPCTGPWGYRHRGWGPDGEGELVPPPLSLTRLQPPYFSSFPPHPQLFCRRIPIQLPDTVAQRHASSSPPVPHPQR